MYPRFVGRLGVADAATTANAVLGFVAMVAVGSDATLAARLILLGAVADGLDGVLARRYGGSEAGPFLDSLADAVTSGVAPAYLVYAVVADAWGVGVGTVATDPLRSLAAVLVPGLFVAMAAVRLALYTAHDVEDHRTTGVPAPLPATVLAAGVLSALVSATVLLAVTAVSVYLMVSPVTYPDLLTRDELIMGTVYALAVLVPFRLGRAFPIALLVLSSAYLFLSPWLYWRENLPLVGAKENA